MGGMESGGLMALRSGPATLANFGLGFDVGAAGTCAPCMDKPLASFTGIAGGGGIDGLVGLGCVCVCVCVGVGV